MRAHTLPVLLLLGCGPKAATPTPAADAGPAAPAEITAEMPDTGDAHAFASRLVGTTIEGFQPTGDGGLVFVWDKWTFAPDGTFRADAHLGGGEIERIPCMENGSWRIDETEDAAAGTLDLEITKTSCPSRDPGWTIRLFVKVDAAGEAKIQRR